MSSIPFLTFPDSGISTGVKGENYIPNPSTYKVQMSDIDLDDKRSTDGFLDRNRVRENVYSVTCSWQRLSGSQLARLLSACQADKFSLKFRDPLNTSDLFTTKSEMYADANKEAELLRHLDEEDEDYWSIELAFVEY